MFRIFNGALCGLLVLMLAACDNSSSDAGHENTALSEQANPTGKTLADRYLIVDTHIDVPFRIRRKPEDIGLATSNGQFDYPRAVQGGLNVPFMSIYIPASVEEAGGATELADELIDYVEAVVEKHPEKFALAYSTEKVQENFQAGKISLAMGMENGGPIAGDLANLQHFYARGIRYITLTHSKSNHIADSSYDDNKRWQGLSEFGKTLIPAMNNLGVMIDISHVSDAAFYDVIALSKTPVIASHSSARHFIPGFERNMDDKMLLALAKNGGVMQLNIGSTFISQKSRESRTELSKLVKDFLESNDLTAESEAGKAAIEKLKTANPFSYATMDDVLDHIDHVVAITSINTVGIGSDFDGVGDTLPVGFKDVSDYPAFIDGLLGRGYSETDIEKILGGNLMRVWRQAEHFAALAASELGDD